MKLRWTRRALEDYERWRREDPAVWKRINAMIRSAQQNPYEGLGRPRALQVRLGGLVDPRNHQQAPPDLPRARRGDRNRPLPRSLREVKSTHSWSSRADCSSSSNCFTLPSISTLDTVPTEPRPAAGHFYPPDRGHLAQDAVAASRTRCSTSQSNAYQVDALTSMAAAESQAGRPFTFILRPGDS